MPEIVHIDNLHYAYPSFHPGDEGQWILRGVNLTIEEGEFVSIMGLTGAGKTTLCLALNGIVPQSTGGTIRGDVIVNGLNTKKEPIADLARLAGLVFQDPETQLFNMSVEAEIAFGLENIGLPRIEMEDRIEWALDIVGMKAFRKRSPFQLSGGQKQRVAIASIIAMQPKILVLDEPTALLDPKGKAEFFSSLINLRDQGMTIVMVEHESELIAEFSDRVVILHDGVIDLDGTPAELFSQFETMQDLGLAVPQVSQLAYQLNKKQASGFAFTQLEDAYQQLSQGLSRKPRGKE